MTIDKSFFVENAHIFNFKNCSNSYKFDIRPHGNLMVRCEMKRQCSKEGGSMSTVRPLHVYVICDEWQIYSELINVVYTEYCMHNV